MISSKFSTFFFTFSRLIASKSIRHDIRCANCKSQVIIGMRYQCLQCLNYDLCQHCFFYGFTSQNHKLSHPMQEYCYKSSRKEATRALLKLISNNLGLNRNSRYVISISVIFFSAKSQKNGMVTRFMIIKILIRYLLTLDVFTSISKCGAACLTLELDHIGRIRNSLRNFFKRLRAK